MANPDILRAFLIESNENLARLDQEMEELEHQPNRDLSGSIFRTIQTIKGTCGFFGLSQLGEIAQMTPGRFAWLWSVDG